MRRHQVDNAYIAVNVLVFLQSGIPEARLGLAEQAAWSTPADETWMDKCQQIDRR
jgi:hypothetical protein